jgi:4-aminobutyrate aminotransferase and related aminotransferases
MAKIAKAGLANGLYLMTHWNVIIVAPPLTITREELDEGLEKLDQALAPDVCRAGARVTGVEQTRGGRFCTSVLELCC